METDAAEIDELAALVTPADRLNVVTTAALTASTSAFTRPAAAVLAGTTRLSGFASTPFEVTVLDADPELRATVLKETASGVAALAAGPRSSGFEACVAAFGAWAGLFEACVRVFEVASK
jgi:hypothetical protein